jgi:sec-independent protein translocase protein TatA
MILAWLDYWTVLLVLFVALLLFGGRLPEVARSLGRSLNEFKRGLNDVGLNDLRNDIERTPDKNAPSQPRLHSPSEPRLDTPQPDARTDSAATPTKTPQYSEVPPEDPKQV